MHAWYSCFGREIIVPAVIAAITYLGRMRQPENHSQRIASD